ncbi:MAG TPA: hypothetical protein VFL55_21720 [Acetobacteraceae bacterium]|nr:hypothetical protein [Acetobacteraceae bacterium]
MFAIGCLIPFALLAVGAVAGGVLGGATGGLWGGGAGFVIGLVAMLVILGVFERAKGDLPE